jgi:hypothetical protein
MERRNGGERWEKKDHQQKVEDGNTEVSLADG